METFDIYQDIMTRTNGDIYIGVVGPVRTGKSTFIKKFVDNLVIPNIADENRRSRIIDELPQSSAGKTIMTTEPKFVPDGGVKVDFGEGLSANVRLIDSVGYIVEDAEGYMEGDTDRMVSTPWSEDKMTFKEAGEYGTKKVIVDHSTVGVVLTTDGSISTIDRHSYMTSENRVIEDMLSLGKPFIIIVNSSDVNSDTCIRVVDELRSKYNVCVMPMNVANMSRKDADNILQSVLMEFPISGVEIDMPSYMTGMSQDNEIINEIESVVLDNCNKMNKMSDYMLMHDMTLDYIDKVIDSNIDFGNGVITYEIKPKDSLFYKVLSIESNIDIKDDYDLINYIKRLKNAEMLYSKMGGAMDEVNSMGYSIVMPDVDDVQLSAPVLYKKAGKCQVKIGAKATSWHIMKVDVDADIMPIMGSESQCNEMIDYINAESQDKDILDVTLFNKPIRQLVQSELESKMDIVSSDAKNKMCRTMTRIVNEGKGGVLLVLI